MKILRKLRGRKRNVEFTIPEYAEAAGLPSRLASHEVAALVKAGTVADTGHVRTGLRGRPPRLYRFPVQG